MLWRFLASEMGGTDRIVADSRVSATATSLTLLFLSYVLPVLYAVNERKSRKHGAEEASVS